LSEKFSEMLVAKWLLLHLLHSIFSEFDFAPDPVGEFTPLHRPPSRLGIPSPHFPTPSMRSASRCLVLTACPVFFLQARGGNAITRTTTYTVQVLQAAVKANSQSSGNGRKIRRWQPPERISMKRGIHRVK